MVGDHEEEVHDRPTIIIPAVQQPVPVIHITGLTVETVEHDESVNDHDNDNDNEDEPDQLRRSLAAWKIDDDDDDDKANSPREPSDYEPYSPAWIEPNPWTPITPASDVDNEPYPIFTDEELVAALVSVDDSDGTEQLPVLPFDTDVPTHSHFQYSEIVLDQSGDCLPDIEVDFGDEEGDDVQQFLEPDQLDSVFEYWTNNNNNNNNNNNSKGTIKREDQLHLIPLDQQLHQLSLEDIHPETVDSNPPEEGENRRLLESNDTFNYWRTPPQDDSDDEDGNNSDYGDERSGDLLNNHEDANGEDLPSQFYCHQCQPPSDTVNYLHHQLPAIGEDQPYIFDPYSSLESFPLNHHFSSVFLRHAGTSRIHSNHLDVDETLLDQLLDLSLLHLDEHEAQLFLEEAAAMEHQAVEALPYVRPLAIQAASPLYHAFGVPIPTPNDEDNKTEQDRHHEEQQGTSKIQASSLQEPTVSKSNSERLCFGHRETIFCVAFSPCANFCATASQDSTIAIWDVATNALITKLEGHSKDYECLRVAWASFAWAADVLDRAGPNHPTATGDELPTRYLLASSDANGVVKLWGCKGDVALDNEKTKGMKLSDWKCLSTLDHSTFQLHGIEDHAKTQQNVNNNSDDDHKDDKKQQQGKDKDDDNDDDDNDNDDDDKPQIYALQFIDHWKAFTQDQQQNSFLMTSSDDCVHIWEVETRLKQHLHVNENHQVVQLRSVVKNMDLKEVMSLQFHDWNGDGYGVHVCSVTRSGLPLPPATKGSSTTAGQGFGGERNPDNKVFVFDASYCPANGLLGVALSDGSLRLINGRGVCVSLISLPGTKSHLTSFCWDGPGRRIVTCVSTGQLIAWALELDGSKDYVVATCVAIMEGGKHPYPWIVFHLLFVC